MSTPPARPEFLVHPEFTALFTENQKWAASMTEKHGTEFFPMIATEKQKPTVLWIGCADSRAPESVLLGARPGAVFVHRNIANQVHLDDSSMLSVLFYAIEELDIKHIVVAGHTNCGGAKVCQKAAAQGANGLAVSTADGGADAPINVYLAPLVRLAAEPESQASLDHLVAANVRAQVANVAASAPVQAAWKKNQKLHVHGWVYRLETGLLEDLHVTQPPMAAPSGT